MLQEQTEKANKPIDTGDSSRVIRIESSPRAKVYAVKLDVVCSECGRTWRVNLLSDYSMPMAWFECLNCKKNKNVNVNKPLEQRGEVKDERTAEQQ